MADEMMDRYQLERRIDHLDTKNPAVDDLAKHARTAMRQREFARAEGLVKQAEALLTPRVSLLDALVNEGGYKSRGAARRVIDAGAVQVDGAQARQPWADVTEAKQITADGRVVRGG